MAGVSDTDFRQMKKFMCESCYTCTDEWLMACMTWVKENNRSVNLNVWKQEISTQWKDANLEEMESTCLPRNLASQRVVKLPGKYGLQVNSIQDIGESAYSQWTKLKKLENENVNVAATDSNEFTQTWQPTAKRCLYLTMTDGSQKVFGMEMQIIRGLDVNMKPGFKVIIQGPVNCRRGVFHLKQNNIRIIGGEVEDLLESNTREKLLADTLKVPLNSIPSGQTQQSVQSGVNEPYQACSTGTSRSRNIGGSSASTISSSRENVMGDFPDSEDPFPDVEEDDDIFMEIDEEALLSSTTTTTGANSSTSRNISQMTTQKISSSEVHRFTEDIEDFEDEDEIRRAPPDPSRNTHPTSRQMPPKPAPSSASSNSTASTSIRKPKPVFVPPIVQPKTTTNQPSSSSSSKSTAGSKSQGDGTITGSTAFRSAKSALNPSSKQLNILQYLRPMPVIIDPPTPERQAAKRRRKSAEQLQISSLAKPKQKVTAIQEESDHMAPLPNENVEPFEDSVMEDDSDVIGGTPPDESFLRIVDETLESKLLECSAEEPSSTSRPTNSKSLKKFPIQVSESPYIYLAQVNEQMDHFVKKRSVVQVKACVSTVVSNIQVEDGCWTLCVCINDGTGYLNCKISANILNNIIGFTPTEMKKIKAAKTKEGKQQIAQGMGNLAKELVHLNAIFALELGVEPMIIEVFDLKLHHSMALKNRLNQVGL